MADIFGRDGETDPLQPRRGPLDQALFERSGQVATADRLVSFLYDLMRDHLPAGVVERLVREAAAPITMTNGYLARYATDLALRLQRFPDGPGGGG